MNSEKQRRQFYDSNARRWSAVKQRDTQADGFFVYSVTTTGVYCRPGCPSKLPRRENVSFHNTSDEAERAGFRPCKRCQPSLASQQDRRAALVSKACSIIRNSESTPALSTLAAEVGMSRHHFHRVFKSALGITPREFAASLRTQRMHAELRNGTPVTRAIYDAGFNSNSRFYERANDSLGMMPGQFRNGGRGVTIQFAVAGCSLGFVLVAGTARGICSVRFGDEPGALERELRREFPKAIIQDGDSVFRRWLKSVVKQIEQPSRALDLPLDVRGTAFQQRVWQALRKIPRGQTASYAEVAARIGQPSASRAVARACATNPVAVVVPCHRVVRTDGGMSGYRWGVERKRKLLEREAAPERRGRAHQSSERRT